MLNVAKAASGVRRGSRRQVLAGPLAFFLRRRRLLTVSTAMDRQDDILTTYGKVDTAVVDNCCAETCVNMGWSGDTGRRPQDPATAASNATCIG